MTREEIIALLKWHINPINPNWFGRFHNYKEYFPKSNFSRLLDMIIKYADKALKKCDKNYEI